MSHVLDNTLDTLREVGDTVREVGERVVRDVPANIPVGRIPLPGEWTADLVDRVGSVRRTPKRRPMRPVLAIVGVVAIAAAIIWFARQRTAGGAEAALDVPGAADAA